MIKKHHPFYITGFVIILALVVSVYFFVFRPQPTATDTEIIPATPSSATRVPNTPTAFAVTPTTIPIVTLPPPLTNVEFPTQTIDYPLDWPSELYYPEQFSVVETASGTLPNDDSTGWATKLRYGGQPANAAEILSSFFLENGWQIVDHIELDTAGFLILIERDNKEGTGIIVIDSDLDDFEHTNIVATIFP